MLDKIAKYGQYLNVKAHCLYIPLPLCPYMHCGCSIPRFFLAILQHSKVYALVPTCTLGSQFQLVLSMLYCNNANYVHYGEQGVNLVNIYCPMNQGIAN